MVIARLLIHNKQDAFKVAGIAPGLRWWYSETF